MVVRLRETCRRLAEFGVSHKHATWPLSGNDVGNDSVFQLRKLVLDGQLLLFHALDLQRIAASRDHRIDGTVEIGMFLLEPRKFETNIRLFLIRHAAI